MLIRTANHGDTCNCHNKYDEELYTLKSIRENYYNGHYYEMYHFNIKLLRTCHSLL